MIAPETTVSESTVPETTQPESTQPETTLPETTLSTSTTASPTEAAATSSIAPESVGAADQAIEPPVLISGRCWVNDGLHVWRLVNPNPFAVDGTFLVDGVAFTTLTVRPRVLVRGFSAPRQPGYVATFIPASAR